MIASLVLVAVLGGGLLLALRWGFRVLPTEAWQIAASVPIAKDADGSWRGGNVTFYGVLLAAAVAFSGAVWVFLLRTDGVGRDVTLGILVAMLAVALPSAKLMAWLVEHRRHTFTVGGAAFASLLLSPVIVAGVSWALDGPPAARLLAPAMAAMGVTFLFGEGLGRLGCISFGCCYGRPVHELGPFGRRLFRRFHFVFHGATKKIAYDSKLEGVSVVPIQALTSTVFVAGGLAGMLLHIAGWHRATFVLAVCLSQGWRVASELLRADYRGGGKITRYQMMGVAAIGYAVVLGFFMSPVGAGNPNDVLAGLLALWDPAVIVALQALALVTLLATGWSMVTGSVLSFHVHGDRIARPDLVARRDEHAAAHAAAHAAPAPAHAGSTPAHPAIRGLRHAPRQGAAS